MSNIPIPLIRLARLSKTKVLTVASICVLILTTSFSRADSDRNQAENNQLAGTWISIEFGGANIVSFISDGRMIITAPVNILTGNGPGGDSELAAPAPGEWIRSGNHQFTTTAYSLLSSPTVGFTHRVKLTGTYKLNKAADELTLTAAMVTVFLPDGNPQFPPFPGVVVHFRRVVAGE